MAAVANAEQLLGVLKKSNLLTPEQFDVVRQLAAETADPRLVMSQVVKRGLLTRWQAQQIYSGVSTLCLGKYKLLDKIGAGGMGTVYRAEHAAMGRIVALKVISRNLTSNPEAVARFHREVHSAARLNHPNIVTAYDADNRGDTHFLVMEHVEGSSLEAWLKQHGRLPIDWACECARQAALGLDHAHKKGMVHRDIKPRNILVASDGPGMLPSVKILDMGLARFGQRGPEEGELTRSDQILGTPDFMAPEQAEDSRTADIRSDIYSLGCTLFKLLTGQVPFPGESVAEKLTARLERDAPRLRTLRPEAPPGLENVLAKMLARRAEDRYQTPAEVADDLAIYSMRQTGGDEDSQTITLCREERPATFSQVGTDSALNDFLGQLSSNLDQNTPTGTGRTLVEGAGATPYPSASARLHRNESPLTAKVAVLSAGVAATGILIVGLLLWHFTRPSMLVLDWPVEERRGAKLTVDEREIPMSQAAKWQIELSPGPHKLIVVRRGYFPLEEEKQLERGEQWIYKPQWIAVEPVNPNASP
jgi:serine/threonine protein kinase